MRIVSRAHSCDSPDRLLGHGHRVSGPPDDSSIWLHDDCDGEGARFDRWGSTWADADDALHRADRWREEPDDDGDGARRMEALADVGMLFDVVLDDEDARPRRQRRLVCLLALVTVADGFMQSDYARAVGVSRTEAAVRVRRALAMLRARSAPHACWVRLDSERYCDRHTYTLRARCGCQRRLRPGEWPHPHPWVSWDAAPHLWDGWTS